MHIFLPRPRPSSKGLYFCRVKMESKTFEKIQKHLRKDVWEAWQDHHLIEDGDKVMVCLSGGKDSYTMLDMLLHYQKTSQITFSIVAVNLDQKQPGFPEDVLPTYLKQLGVDFVVKEKDTYSIVTEKIAPGKTMCSLCSRLRRGNLYALATELNATKIALGHHRDDIVETFFMNLFNGARMAAMPAKYTTDDGVHQVIRPLAYCKEKEIALYATAKNYPIIPCTLCGSQENMMRKKVKSMLHQWETEYPGRTSSIFNALKNVQPGHLLDHQLLQSLQHVAISEDSAFI